MNWEALRESLMSNLAMLPGNLSNHLLITVLPLTLAVMISLPLAVLAVRHPKLRYPALTVVSIIQTIPSLALLALMVPLLVGLGYLTSRWFGFEVSALGFYPTVIALTLYGMLPMLRNMVTGILGVDPALTEAGRGAGMTDRQLLWKVELPLALPVMIAGVRTATVWTVGIATLATPVGQQCLGNYIFRGLHTRDWFTVLFGCVAAAVVAIVLDLLIGALQKAAEERRRGLGWSAGVTLMLIATIGLTGPWVIDLMRGQQRAVIVGSKTFTEQYILADLIGELLRDAGISVRERESLGSTVIFDGLTAGEVDVYIDYTGTIWANHMGREGSAPPRRVLDEVKDWLQSEHEVHTPGTLGFENAYALAMRREQAAQLGIETIDDLAGHADQLKLGSDYEFLARPEWDAVRTAYGLRFGETAEYDSTFMYEAIRNEEVDVISAFTTDGRIKAYDLVLLDDPKQAIPPYDALLLLSPATSGREDVIEALRPVLDGITLDMMQRANYMVDRDKDSRSVAEAARWLREQVTGKYQAEKQAATEGDGADGDAADGDGAGATAADGGTER